MNEKRSITRRRLLGGVLPSMAALACPSIAVAQRFPDRPIRLLVGFAPGGGTDALARLVASGMTEVLRQQVVVENRSGANGNLATAAVVQARPDGYTLLLSSAAQIVVSPATFTTMPVDPVGDLSHLTMVGDGDFFVAINAQLPAANAAEFIALAKAQPGKFNYGTAGAGGILHLAGELFKLRAGIDMAAVHYRGAGAVIPELISGQIQVGIDGASTMEPNIKAGRVRPLFVMAKQRSPVLPDVPTVREAGLAQLDEISNWYGLHGPRGMPSSIAEQLRDAAQKAVNDPVIKERAAAIGLLPVQDTPASFTARIKAELANYREVAKAADIKVE
jgi:tripartite-type tricarboxylate transporter receptor subunit TctC